MAASKRQPRVEITKLTTDSIDFKLSHTIAWYAHDQSVRCGLCVCVRACAIGICSSLMLGTCGPGRRCHDVPQVRDRDGEGMAWTGREHALPRSYETFTSDFFVYSCLCLLLAICSVANALRRVIIAEVATMAIEEVIVFENSSVFDDEFIAHRLGLIPLESHTAEQFKYPWECTCGDSCENCSVTFYMDVEGPDPNDPASTHRTVHATSKDLLTDALVKPIPTPGADGIMIVKLGHGQRVHIEAKARKGIGKLHAKWSPAVAAYYHDVPHVAIRDHLLNELSADMREAFAKCCPSGVFKYNPVSERVEVVDAKKCTFCGDCALMAESFDAMLNPGNEKFKKLVSVTAEPDTFMFHVESTGALPPEQIVASALEALKHKITKLQQHVRPFIQAGANWDD